MSKQAVAALIGLLLVAGVFTFLAPGQARADSAPLVPSPATPATVTADGLPTVQHNGVAWSQVVVGDIVYVAGQFSRARPAGAAPGTQEVVRNNLLAYNITNGQLVTSFAPSLNAQAMVITASPDGSRLYVGGDFTSVNGVARNRVAALAPVTGALVTTFAPSVSSQVRAIAATNTAVYLGGNFGSVNGNTRNRLAAVQASNGAILPWAPQPGDGPTSGNWHPNPANNTATSHDVMAMVATNGGSQIVVAGRFDTLNGADATGVGALDAATGATRPFTIGTIITNQGVNASIFSLSTDGTNVYGTGYDFYGPGNLEGSFAVTADGGNVIAINDCHGDHYSAFATGGALYLAGHPHDCSSAAGFPEFNPRINKFATAVTITAEAGVVGNNAFGSGQTRGLPAAKMLPWFPTMSPGSYTGQGQAGWSVTGNDRYVVFGGEFPRVNGVGQQGLVRYAIPSLATNKQGPDYNDALLPTAVSLSAGTARISWQATFDNDNENLKYRVIRADRPATPVYETTVASTFWNRPTVGFIDRGLTPGASYTYRVYAIDPFNNQAMRGPATVTVSNATGGGGLYSDTVLADTPNHYWRLDEAAGAAKSYDQAGFDDLNVSAGVTRGAEGALAGTPNTSADFSGASDGLAATAAAVPGPQVFSVEAWFNTTTTSGGKLVGFGNRNTDQSDNYDRHVYMTDDGRLRFGVYPGFLATVGNDTRFNDGQWHHVVATLGSTGMALYVDGQVTGQRGDVTTAQDYNGYWRLGGDTSWEGGTWFDGRIDDVATYPTALTLTQAQRHFAVGSTGQPFNEPPTASFTSSANGLAASFDGSASADPDGTIASRAWEFGDGGTGSGATATHTYANPGTYRVKLTVTDNRGATATVSHAITVLATGTAGGPYSNAVLSDGAAHYWRLGEPSGAGYDMAGQDDLVVRSGVTRGTAGAIQGDGDKAATFDGSESGSASMQTRTSGPNVFSIEAWFNTTTTNGGKIVGFGNEQAGNYSSNYDRHVFMDESGRLIFGVWTGDASVVYSNPGLNNGQWHHVVAMLSPAGLAMYVDGQLAQSRSDITAGQGYDGYWRIGGDSTWAGAPFFAGAIDDVAIYPAALSASQVQQHYTLASNVPPPNPAPVADFTSTVNGLTVDVDGSASTDNGSIASYAWAYEGGGSDTGVTASHTFGATGTYDVTLTVTDNQGATNSVTKEVSVTAPPANVPPNAAFTSTVNNLNVTVNGTTSSDSDGQINSYAWNFGDGGTATGATPAPHAYATAGTYTITLVVTDDDGATDDATAQVAVSAPAGPVVVAADAFNRTGTNGLGTADTGGAWTALYGSTRQSVNNGVGTFSLAAGTQAASYLNSVSETGVDLTSTVWLGQQATGGGVNVLITGRRVGLNQEYRLRLRFLANGQVWAGWTRLNGSTADTLIGAEVLLPGGAYVAGTPLRVRLNVSGTGTTLLNARIWNASAAEPTTWNLARTDTTASLQAAGGVGVMGYLSGAATTVPVTVNVAAWEARRLG
ncbi:PKD domain-containing protein [Blastococcus sp. CT_GayMR16]|uniref:PKD domain-containing protein n=1 Tax=Blastococcus sp. CT_GayMR16 TaxID=2559607 RepID=UPI001073FD34|nr:PKD domain-containing protein [Blastococcus sp. CT_GayMR16]TFV90711.1 PKD domain-containing protein [Blastococcus sp. CT_GayMR16]